MQIKNDVFFYLDQTESSLRVSHFWNTAILSTQMGNSQSRRQRIQHQGLYTSPSYAQPSYRPSSYTGTGGAYGYGRSTFDPVAEQAAYSRYPGPYTSRQQYGYGGGGQVREERVGAVIYEPQPAYSPAYDPFSESSSYQRGQTQPYQQYERYERPPRAYEGSDFYSQAYAPPVFSSYASPSTSSAAPWQAPPPMWYREEVKPASSMRGSMDKYVGSLQAGMGKLLKNEPMYARGTQRKVLGETQRAAAKNQPLPSDAVFNVIKEESTGVSGGVTGMSGEMGSSGIPEVAQMAPVSPARTV